jgi:hypothetical protein
MDPLDAIGRAKATRLVDKDDDEVEFELAPSLLPADIDARGQALQRLAGPGTLDRSAAPAGDERMSTFAAELDDRFTFVDLRSPPVGLGFSWGRYGPRTDVRPHGDERLFAYAPLEKRPGALRRLFAG